MSVGVLGVLADKDEGPAPPINLIMLCIHLAFALMRLCPLTRRFAPVRRTETKHHHFTVFCGTVATAESAVCGRCLNLAQPSRARC